MDSKYYHSHDCITDPQFIAKVYDTPFEEKQFDAPKPFLKTDEPVIVFVFDKKFEQAVYSLYGVIEHNDNFNLCLVTDIAEDNKYIQTILKMIDILGKAIQVHFIPFSAFGIDELKGYDESIRRDLGKIVWYRLLLPWVIDSPKILYMDADITCQGCFMELFNIEFGDKLIAAVKDYTCLDWYYNAGFMMINAKGIKAEFSFSDFKNLIRFYSEKVLFSFKDQDFMNFVLKGRIFQLPYIYNMFSLSDLSIFKLEEAKNVHFAGDSYWLYQPGSGNHHSPRQCQLSWLYKQYIDAFCLLHCQVDLIDKEYVSSNRDLWKSLASGRAGNVACAAKP